MDYKSIIAASLGLSLMSSAVAAADDAPYFGLYGGLNFQEDSDISVPAASSVSGKADTDTGYVFGGVAGYQFGLNRNDWSIRTELDVGYRENDLDSLSGSIAGLGSASTSDVDGDLSTFSGMVNAWWDYNAGNFRPYFGGGIGAANVSANNVSVSGTEIVDDSEIAFAYQLGAGIGYKLTEAMSLSFDYRYFATDDADLNVVSGEEFELDTSNHSLMVGFRHSF